MRAARTTLRVRACASPKPQVPTLFLTYHAVEGDALEAHLFPKKFPIDTERVARQSAASQRQGVHSRNHVLKALHRKQAIECHGGGWVGRHVKWGGKATRYGGMGMITPRTIYPCLVKSRRAYGSSGAQKHRNKALEFPCPPPSGAEAPAAATRSRAERGLRSQIRQQGQYCSPSATKW